MTDPADVVAGTWGGETFRTVVGYEEAYEVSDLGRVRSLDRLVAAGQGRTRLTVGRLLSIYTGDRYSKVRLKMDSEGRTMNVHQLVAQAFLGPCPPGLEVCHNNGQNHDNRLVNLRYDTHVANCIERTEQGGSPYANRTHCGHGHEFTPENTRIRIGGGRVCRTCDRYLWRSRTKSDAA